MAAGDDQPEIHMAADEADRELVDALLAMIGLVATAALERQILAAMAKRQVGRVVDVVRTAMAPALAVLEAQITNRLLNLEARTFRIAATTLDITAIGSLNLTNPAAVDFARNRGSRFVAQFDAELQQMLRTLVSGSFIHGIPPRETAELLRASIGLTTNQVTSVENYQRFLQSLGDRGALTGLPESVLDRIRRSDVRLLPKQGSSMNEERIDTMVARYERRLLKERALTLVSTESMAASNEGQRILWNDAVTKGLLDPATARKKFIITRDEKTCPICRPMAGQIQKINEDFVSPYNGARSKTPPMHMRCRCTMGFVRIRNASAA